MAFNGNGLYLVALVMGDWNGGLRGGGMGVQG